MTRGSVPNFFTYWDLRKSYVLSLFNKKYSSGAVRNISVYYSYLVDESFGLISLFDDIEKIEKEERLQTAIDSIRDQFGFTSLLKANALDSASRSIARSSLIGGHSAGGLDGLKWLIVPIYHFKQQENTRTLGCRSGWGSFCLSIPHHYMLLKIVLTSQQT